MDSATAKFTSQVTDLQLVVRLMVSFKSKDVLEHLGILARATRYLDRHVGTLQTAL